MALNVTLTIEEQRDVSIHLMTLLCALYPWKQEPRGGECEGRSLAEAHFFLHWFVFETQRIALEA